MSHVMITSAERYDGHGRRIEMCEVSANRVGDQVHLHIKGRGPAKQWVMPADAWAALARGTTTREERQEQ